MSLVPGAAVVTGASRGIGAACALALARAGASVAVNFHESADRAAEVVEVIRRDGGTAIAVRADVTSPGELDGLAETVQQELGPVSILVSNAAPPPHLKPFLEHTWADFDRELHTFPRPFFHLAQAFLPGMIQHGVGRLVVVGSNVVDIPIPGSHAYVAAKAGLDGLVRSLATEVGRHGVTVNVVVPALTDTERAAVVSDEFKAEHAARVPVGRIGAPEDVAGAVVYLASEEAQFVTGTRIVVDGGYALS